MANDTIKAVDALVRTLKDGEPSVRQAAANALGEIGRVVMTVLIRALEDEDPQVRRSAAQALGLITPTQDNAVNALREALKDKNLGVCDAALNALDKIMGRS